MNNVVLIGNLGADPESIFTDEGTQICNFSIAFKSTKKDKTNWIKVVCFNKLAEIANTYLHKGAKVCISGKLDQHKWVTEENQTRSTYRLIGNDITFIKTIKTDGRGFETQDPQDDPTQNNGSMNEAPF